LKLSDVLHIKQRETWSYLINDYTTEILYGGAAGGGKSFLGNLWLFRNCEKYPGSRWLMGRSKLKSLKQTTLATFFEIAEMYGWGDRFIYNAQMGEINFVNGSQIILKDLFTYPSDPNFDSLGSLEITGAFIDECNQISHKAKSIVASRIRYKLGEFNLVPKIFMSCNPAKNWVYSEFYLPSKAEELKDYQKFVQALPTDNPHISPHYIENLKKLPKNSRERLLYGNWEHDDDPTKLIKYSSLFECVKSSVIPDLKKKVITCDVAALGSDDLILIVWYGFFAIEVVKMGKSGGKDIEDAVTALQKKHGIEIENCIFDADGVGALIGGKGGILAGARRFNNGSRPSWVKKENFKNLKSFCAYKFAKRVNGAGYNFYMLSQLEDWDRIVRELEQLKGKNMDDDERTWAIIAKSEMKKILGFSPDYMDALLMREWFEYAPSAKKPKDPETGQYDFY
jgi:phage terminase large subunit